MADMSLLIFQLRPPALEEVGLVAALKSRLDRAGSSYHASKHANQVKVELMYETGCLRLTIEENGFGCNPEKPGPSGGQGIRNIRQRAEKIGARCWIESAPGQATNLTIEVQK
jgi:signal transduction histidine kinase